MAGIKSTFYDTLPDEGVNEVEWAKSAKSRGPLYGVDGPNDLRLTAHPTTPYAVNLSPGKFWGHGIWDEAESVVRVQCVAPAQGAYRWDLIPARRDWQPTGGGPTSLLALQGSTDGSKIVSVRENRPGEIDDQPLWAVQWKGGQTQPNAIVDLRCWPSNGGVEIADKLSLNYLAAPGAAVKLGRSMWRYEPQANSVWDWQEYPMAQDDTGHFDIGTNGSAYGAGWEAFDGGGYARLAARQVGKEVQIFGSALARKGAGPASVVAVMPPGKRPWKKTPGIRCEMNPDGALRAEIAQPTNATPSFFVSYFVA